MKEYKIYEGQLQDKELGEALDELLKTPRENLIYLDWNGFILRIYPNSTKQELLNKYTELIAMDGAWARVKNKEYISVQELSNKIAKVLMKLGE